MRIEGNMEENRSLAPFTTFGIGGPARWFVEARNEDEIVEAVAWARERELAVKELPVFVRIVIVLLSWPSVAMSILPS